MVYQVSLTESVQEDIAFFEADDQRIIVAGIVSHLNVDAEVSGRKRKQLRPNPVAPWELRIDTFRVFYSVDGDQVEVMAVGHKEHDDLFIRGQKVEL